MNRQISARDDREWGMALAVARLAPDTGMVTMTAAALLAGNAELERLRGQVAEWEKLADLLGEIDRAQAPSRHQGALL